MMKNKISAITELKIANEGMSNLLSSMYSNIMESTYDYKHKLGEIAELSKKSLFGILDTLHSSHETCIPMSKQKKFMTIIYEMGYVNISELKAYVPEGMCVRYSVLIDALKPCIKYVSNIEADRVIPYELLLGNLVSNKSYLISLDTNEAKYSKMQEKRDGVLKDLNDCYNPNSTESVSNVKRLVNNNSEWNPILLFMNTDFDNINKVNISELKSRIVKMNTYLDILISMSKDNDVTVTPETIRYLSNGSYQIAKELEFFSSTYFRLMQFKGSIENTMDNIIDIYK